MIDIHPLAKVSRLADIEDSVRGSRILIGAHASLDSFVKVKPAGGNGDLIIGERTVINSGCVLYTGNGIHIGNDVAIAANCTFAPVNHSYKDKSRRINQQGFLPSRGGILIEDDVWIGANAIILSSVGEIGEGAVVAANAVVTRPVEPLSVVAGVPAKHIRYRSSHE